MTTAAAVASLSPDDLLRMPERDGYELVEGVPTKRLMSIGSTEVEATVTRLLGDEASRTKEARVFANSLGYQCYAHDPELVRKPDGSVIRRERTNGIANDRGYMPIPADLAIEVVSLNDLSYEVAEKAYEYLDAGFPLVWVVHPNVRTVTVYRAGKKPVILGPNDEITAEPALREFRCQVSAFFI